jgi:predicted  nucleic acid-binding Zn-ribbon protein
MAITRQLFQLEELDAEIEQKDLSLAQKQSRVGNRDALNALVTRLAAEQQQLAELKHRHREAEADVTDHLTRVAGIEGQLYGGKVTNPKELSGLQHEFNTLKALTEELENQTLEIIDRVEAAENVVMQSAAELKALETEWQQEQQQLSEEIEQLQKDLIGLHQQRQGLAAQLDTSALSLYEKIRQQKKPAVSRVERGICRACRISLSASALQRARGGQPIQCGTCGRILYIS